MVNSAGTYTYMTDINGVDQGSAYHLTGPHQGPITTPWMNLTASNGYFHLRFRSDGSAVNCNGGTNNCTGIQFEGYEYRQYQSGVTPVWTALRFPGQYFDAETELHENWNRFYDPSIGRYLAPEPLWQTGSAIASSAGAGRSTPVYAYAGNNPVMNADPNGRASAGPNDVLLEFSQAFGNTMPEIGDYLAGFGAALGGFVVSAQAYAAAVGSAVTVGTVTVTGAVVGIVIPGNLFQDCSSGCGELPPNYMEARSKQGSKPKDCPPGTIPIDETGLSRDDVHGIKEGISAGPRDWTGISPDGHVIGSDGQGNAVDHGPMGDYLP